MVSPTIVHSFSVTYDMAYAEALKIPWDQEKGKKAYATFQRRFKRYWKKSDEKRVLKWVARVNGLKWKKESIPIYYVNHLTYGGISDPLTILIHTKYMPVNRETLIHELTHRLYSQHFPNKIKKLNRHLEKIYPNEDWGTTHHIPVNMTTLLVY